MKKHLKDMDLEIKYLSKKLSEVKENKMEVQKNREILGNLFDNKEIDDSGNLIYLVLSFTENHY